MRVSIYFSYPSSILQYLFETFTIIRKVNQLENLGFA